MLVYSLKLIFRKKGGRVILWGFLILILLHIVLAYVGLDWVRSG